MENLSAADVAAVTHPYGGYGYGDGFGFGGGSGIWLFAILALMWGGNGFFGRNGIEGRCATVEDLNNSANFTRLENQVQGIGTTQLNQFNNLTNAISTLGYETLRNFNNLGTQVADCCCGINRNIDNVRFDMANYSSAINANTTAQVQKVLDALNQDKISAQQARISQLELQQALCGVVRYPTNASYAIGTPFNVGYGYGCCGCNNVNI